MANDLFVEPPTTDFCPLFNASPSHEKRAIKMFGKSQLKG